MLERRVDFVFEPLPIDRTSPSSRASRIPGLKHEAGYDAMKDDIIVVAALRECHEILASLEEYQLVWNRQNEIITVTDLGGVVMVKFYRKRALEPTLESKSTSGSSTCYTIVVSRATLVAIVRAICLPQLTP